MWTFNTVPNAKWSDGQPLTANDAEFTFSTILKYGDGPAGNLVGGLTNVKSPRPPTTTRSSSRTRRRRRTSCRSLQQLPILPQHVWQQYAIGDGKGCASSRTSPPTASRW